MTRTPTATPTITLTPTVTPTPTITLTPTITRTATPTIPPEPVITFFGLSRANDTLVPASGTNDQGLRIYQRTFGSGFSLVVEGRPGGLNSPVGNSTFDWNPSNPAQLPDLLVVVSRDLGNGSIAVCDELPPDVGGVPAAILPDVLPPEQAVSDAVNDLGCRFKNGSGVSGGRGAEEACTVFDDGRYRFVDGRTTRQFCGLITEPVIFPPGDTVVTARIRDQQGLWSAPSSIVLRVSP